MVDQTQEDGPIRALRVLETLAGLQQPASLPAIADKAQLSKSKAYRVLRGLQDHGFVDHAGHSGYRIGSRAIALATLIGPRPALLQIARPLLARLAAQSSETVTLHLRSAEHRVLVLAAEPPSNPMRGLPTIGERSPLTSGCVGRAILAFLPRNEAEQIIRAHSPQSVGRRLPALLARIREQGYALSFSDNHTDLNGIAAPLLDPVDGTALGSIAIAGVDRRLPEETLLRLSAPLRAACADLAPRLATVLGPNSSIRLESLDVVAQEFLDQP